MGTAALLGLQIIGGLAAGFTAPIVAAAAPSPVGHPNRANPLAGTTSGVRTAPKTAAPNPKPAPLLAQAAPPSVPMAPGSLALTPTGGTFVGSDGVFEVDVPAGAVTAADLTASGGSMSLLVRQVLPASGGSAGGSGIVTYGLYLIQVLDASGKLTSRSLHSPLTVKLHVSVLDPTRTLLVLNQALPPWFDATPISVPVTPVSGARTQAPAGTTSPKPLQPALGRRTSVRTALNTSGTSGTSGSSLSGPFTLSGPNMSVSWDSTVPVAAFGKPDPFEPGLSSGSLTAG